MQRLNSLLKRLLVHFQVLYLLYKEPGLPNTLLLHNIELVVNLDILVCLLGEMAILFME